MELIIGIAIFFGVIGLFVDGVKGFLWGVFPRTFRAYHRGHSEG